MVEVRVEEFTHNFDEYRRRAEREVVAVTDEGETKGYFISVSAYEELERYRAMARRSFATAALPERTVRLVAASTMDSRHADLNRLLDDPD